MDLGVSTSQGLFPCSSHIYVCNLRPFMSNRTTRRGAGIYQDSRDFLLMLILEALRKGLGLDYRVVFY